MRFSKFENQNMTETAPEIQTDLRQAFREYERGVRIHNYRVACILALIFMPAGSVLDYVVYNSRLWPGAWQHFLMLRLICSALLLFIWWFVRTPMGLKRLWAMGQIVAALPSLFISVMIYETEGALSPYYAGINIVLLGAALILRWNLLDSIVVVLTAIGMYLAACVIHGFHGSLSSNDFHIFFNNLYFLFVTGVFVVIGNLFYNRVRFREFELRYQLDKSREALEASNQKLVELDQVKGRFFANISHELRTPLTLLLAPLEALMPRFSLDPETKNLLVTMQANGMRLLKLINDLLDLVRLESGRLEAKHEPLEVGEFVKGLASAARQVADDKRLRLEVFIDPDLGTVLSDRDKLEKIILNLVFNALKFTPSGGRVELRAEKKGDLFMMIVADTGMGISAKNLPFVFDRFWQADDSSKRKYQGVGIGLALVKELVEVQGGTVSVQSEQGKGTTFTVQLPYQKAEIVKKEGEEKPPGGSPALAEESNVTSEEWLANLYRRAELFPALTPLQDSMRPMETGRNGNLPTLLVADDEPDMLRFLKSQLSSRYRVVEAVDGQQAIEKASQFLPDIILLDMMMPEKDGLQACREIRERTPTASIPIILLTARADEETKLAALSAGASDFLSKPFSTTELHVRIKNLVESHQYQRKVSKQNQVLESTIDQLKDTESQLVQSEKLASLGRMSAGIIHEINNPLNFATTGLFTLRNKGKYLAADQQQDYQEVLKDVEEGIKRVKTIVSDLRMFTHPDTESRDQVEVSEVVASSLRFMSAELRDKVQIEQDLAEHQTIWANKNKLIHLLVNLFQNSLDAMKSKVFEGEKPTLWIESRVERGRSLLIVRDNGMGIGAEHLDKIFDPFFTTKDVGEGMGLGLSICYRIVQDCEGKISVRTEPGKFCEFTLEFPAKG
jgi:signal transduction histidine kinase